MNMTQTQGLSRRDFFKNTSAAVALLASAKGRSEALTYPLSRMGEQNVPAPAQPMVEIEEDVYHFEPSDNGSGPLWCHGSTCLVRVGNDCFASGVETLPGVKPLNNCRWLLLRRGPDGWKQIQADVVGRTREPSPRAPIRRKLRRERLCLTTGTEVVRPQRVGIGSLGT
jgi:hypothetical protein